LLKFGRKLRKAYLVYYIFVFVENLQMMRLVLVNLNVVSAVSAGGFFVFLVNSSVLNWTGLWKWYCFMY